MKRVWQTKIARYRESSTFLPGVVIGFCAGVVFHILLTSLVDLVRGPEEVPVAEVIEENLEEQRQKEPIQRNDEPRDVSPGDSVAVDDAADTVGFASPDSRLPDRILRSPSGLVIPVAGIAPSELYDSFDDGRSEGRSHDALDIPAPEGTPVLAATGGEILRFFTSERGGLTIYQRGDDGLIYYYAHLQGYAPGIGEGMRVEAGDVIAWVGNTGNAGPDNYHLHFAIWSPEREDSYWDGVPINPYPLLTGTQLAGDVER